MEPGEIFKLEPEEALEKAHSALTVLHGFKDIYHEHRNKLKEYFKDKEPLEWEFASPLVFARLDKYMERLATLEVRSGTLNRI